MSPYVFTAVVGIVLSQNSVLSDLPLCLLKGFEDGTYPDPNSCLRYYRCIAKRQFHLTCPPGTAFSVYTKGCDHLSKVPSCKGIPWKKIGRTCGDLEDGFYPNPVLCSSYYRCIGHKAVFYFCPDGTIFDSTVETCNFPENVTSSEMNCRMIL